MSVSASDREFIIDIKAQEERISELSFALKAGTPTKLQLLSLAEKLHVTSNSWLVQLKGIIGVDDSTDGPSPVWRSTAVIMPFIIARITFVQWLASMRDKISHSPEQSGYTLRLTEESAIEGLTLIRSLLQMSNEFKTLLTDEDDDFPMGRLLQLETAIEQSLELSDGELHSTLFLPTWKIASIWDSFIQEKRKA